MSGVDVSIQICTRNRRRDLEQTLAALQRLAIPAGRTAELLIVDNGSSDGTAEVIRDFRWAQGAVRGVHAPTPGKGHAYNAGFAAANGDVILLTDDDVRPPAAWVATLCEPIWLGRAEVVAGGVAIAPHLHRAWMTPRLRSFLSSTELLDASHPEWVVASNLAVARRVLERVPAFDPALGPGALGFEDEVLFSWQAREAGYRVVGALSPPVEHWFDAARLTRGSLVRYLLAHGRSKGYVAYHWQHVDDAHPTWRRWTAHARHAVHRLTHPAAWGEREGITDDEAELLVAVGRAEQYLIESRGRRHYARHGLVKLATH